MARVVHRRWLSTDSAPSRRDARGCEYEAYIPDLLVGRSFTLNGEVAADVADAERAITRLTVAATSLSDTEALARILLRAESVASSRIEGLEVGARRLLRAEAAMQFGEQPTDVTATDVLANIEAMSQAIQALAPGDELDVDHLL